MSFRIVPGGARATLVTDLPADEVERRINDRARTLFGSESTRASGWASFGHLRLWCEAQPRAGDLVLAGRIHSRAGGTVLHLRYRSPWPQVVFTAVICLGLAVYLLWVLLHVRNLLALPFLAALLLAPFAFLFPGANAEFEMAYLLDFLRDTLDARDTEAEPLAQE